MHRERKFAVLRMNGDWRNGSTLLLCFLFVFGGGGCEPAFLEVPFQISHAKDI